MKSEPMLNRAEGFSFIELLLVLTLLAIIAGLGYPLLSASTVRHKEAELKQALLDIRRAIDEYRADVQAGARLRETETGYPPSLDALLKPGGSGTAPYLRALPADPFFVGEYRDSAKTWLLRSYQSPPDNPQAGADVYDVRSSSDEIGSNGMPYSKW